MAVIAELKAMLGLDASKYKSEMGKAKKETKSFKDSVAGIGRLMGVAFSASAIIGFGKSLVSYADKMSDSAKAAGLFTSELIALNQVAMQSGSDLDQVTKLFGKMESRSFDAANGVGDFAKQLQAAGINVGDFLGLSPVEKMQALGEAAQESASPIGFLSDIFGERLGPSAMQFITTVTQGMPLVDSALGDTVDQVGNLDDKWAVMVDNFKLGALKVVGSLKGTGAFIKEFFMAPDIASGIDAGTKAFNDVQQTQNDEANKRSDERQKKRDEELKGLQDQWANVGSKKVNGEEELDKEREKRIAKRIEQIRKLKGERSQLNKEAMIGGGGGAGAISIATDQVQTMGGSIGGGDRSGLEMRDRAAQMQNDQSKTMLEQLAVNKEIRKLQADQNRLTESVNVGVNKLAEVLTESKAADTEG